ncbi:MAG: hypothetical protein Q4C56_08690, partial [Peptococcaceae bacterium]|nr:hypothetical protein [Peptococcaceae bacterium]
MVGLGISYFFGVVYCYGITNWVLGIDNSAWQVFLSGCLLVAPGNIVCAFLAVAIVKRLAPQLQYLYH